MLNRDKLHNSNADIFILAFSYDWNEGYRVAETPESAEHTICALFDVEQMEDAYDAYENGKWKAFQSISIRVSVRRILWRRLVRWFNSKFGGAARGGK